MVIQTPHEWAIVVSDEWCAVAEGLEGRIPDLTSEVDYLRITWLIRPPSQ